MDDPTWQQVVLAAINVVQVVMLGYLASRQHQLHSRINGGIDEWVLRREQRAQRGGHPEH